MRAIKILSIVQKFSKSVSKLNLNKMAVFLHQKERVSDSERNVTFFIGKILKEFDLTRNDFTLETFSLRDDALKSFIFEKESIIEELKSAKTNHELHIKQNEKNLSRHEMNNAFDKLIAFDSIIKTIENLISDAEAQLLLREMSK